MARRSRWERLYTDDGECVKDHKTGYELVIRKLYGYDYWSVTVKKHEKGVGWVTLHDEPSCPRPARPRRADLAELVDSL